MPPGLRVSADVPTKTRKVIWVLGYVLRIPGTLTGHTKVPATLDLLLWRESAAFTWRRNKERLSQESRRAAMAAVTSAAASSSPAARRRGGSIIRLNVGGVVFATTRGTLQNGADSFFTALVNDAHTHAYDEASGAIFIDRDPTHFRHVLNYLREGAVPLERSDDAQQISEILRRRSTTPSKGRGKTNSASGQTDTALTKEKSGEKEYKIKHARQEQSDALIEEWTNKGYDVMSIAYGYPDMLSVCFVKHFSRPVRAPGQTEQELRKSISHSEDFFLV